MKDIAITTLWTVFYFQIKLFNLHVMLNHGLVVKTTWPVSNCVIQLLYFEGFMYIVIKMEGYSLNSPWVGYTYEWHDMSMYSRSPLAKHSCRTSKGTNISISSHLTPVIVNQHNYVLDSNLNAWYSACSQLIILHLLILIISLNRYFRKR